MEWHSTIDGVENVLLRLFRRSDGLLGYDGRFGSLHMTSQTGQHDREDWPQNAAKSVIHLGIHAFRPMDFEINERAATDHGQSNCAAEECHEVAIQNTSLVRSNYWNDCTLSVGKVLRRGLFERHALPQSGNVLLHRLNHPMRLPLASLLHWIEWRRLIGLLSEP